MELNYTPSPAPIQKQEPEASGNFGKPTLPLGRSAKGRSPLDSEACSNKAELCFHQRKGERHHGAAEPG